MSRYGMYSSLVCIMLTSIFTNTEMYGLLPFYSYGIHDKADELTSRPIHDGDKDTCIYMDQRWVAWNHKYMTKAMAYYVLGRYSVKNATIFLQAHGENQHGMTVVYQFLSWPYFKKVDLSNIPERVDIDILSQERYFHVYFISPKGQDLNFSVCEIETYGCEYNYFGDLCEPCDTADKCQMCDVVDGSCEQCSPGLSGPNCTNKIRNVAYQRGGHFWDTISGRMFYANPNAIIPFLHDGSDTTCVDIINVPRGFYQVDLEDLFNVLRINIILNKNETEIWDFSLTVSVPNQRSRDSVLFPNRKSIPDVIKLHTNQTARKLPIEMRFVGSYSDWYEHTVFQICEVEVYGCYYKDDPCILCQIENCKLCDDDDTVCFVCSDGFTDPQTNCTQECPAGHYGTNCSYDCGECANASCHHITGNCSGSCRPGWTGQRCNKVCPPGLYGESCEQPCSSHCKTPHICNHVDGTCEDGCEFGWINEKCNQLNTTHCVDWVPSSVQVKYHRMVWKTSTVMKSGKNHTTHDPAVALICDFSPAEDESLSYEIQWFIGNQPIPLNQTINNSSRFSAILTSYDMNLMQKKAGTMIHCIVGAKREKYDKPCLTTNSTQFFAGIKISSQQITLERKGTAHRQLQMTIPFASETEEIDGEEQPVSSLTVSVTDPNYNPANCIGGLSVGQCQVQIAGFKFSERERYDTDEWQQNHTFAVNNYDTDGYVINDRMTLQLKTGETRGNGSQIFSNLRLPDVQVNVIETETLWKGKTCSVRTDPHMHTFDKKSYECHLDGSFVLYRNAQKLQEIQTKHHQCFTSYDGPRCVCAVVFRAGRDVFIFDMCYGNDTITYAHCQDKVLQVKSIQDKFYKIYFPTGTSVSVYLTEYPAGHYNIDLEIVPSLPDVNNTMGLCGTLDNNISNEFLRRDSSVENINHVYPDEFSNSWQVQDTENLFRAEYNQLSPIASVERCACSNTQRVCSNITFTPCISEPDTNYPCPRRSIINNSSRRKRAVKHVVSRKKRNVPTNVTSNEEAESKCIAAFDKSSAYFTCQQHVTDLTNITLENCIKDIMMTGDDNITMIHVEAALQQCATFIRLNATLQEAEPAVTYQILTLCPNNCSDHGICSNGNCTCYAGYAGSDCSFDLLGPPSLSFVPQLCDSSTEDCSAITIKGRYFLENMASSCYVTIHQKNIKDSIIKTQEIKVDLQKRTLFEGYCPTETKAERLTWSTEVYFNISNDDIKFTQNYKVQVYQSICQELHNESNSVYFTLKNQFCFISGTCLKDGHISSHDACVYCNTSKDTYDWSIKPDCISTSTVPETTSRLETTAFRMTSTLDETTAEGLTTSKKEQSSTSKLETSNEQDTTNAIQQTTKLITTTLEQQITTAKEETKEAVILPLLISASVTGVLIIAVIIIAFVCICKSRKRNKSKNANLTESSNLGHKLYSRNNQDNYVHHHISYGRSPGYPVWLDSYVSYYATRDNERKVTSRAKQHDYMHTNMRDAM